MQRENSRTSHRSFALLLVVLSIYAALILLSLPACNTLEGVGRDVSEAGKAMSGAARDVGGNGN